MEESRQSSRGLLASIENVNVENLRSKRTGESLGQAPSLNSLLDPSKNCSTAVSSYFVCTFCMYLHVASYKALIKILCNGVDL